MHEWGKTYTLTSFPVTNGPTVLVNPCGAVRWVRMKRERGRDAKKRKGQLIVINRPVRARAHASSPLPLSPFKMVLDVQRNREIWYDTQ